MNIKSELLREHSKKQAEKIARYACRGKKEFSELMECYLSANIQLAQRAAWSVGIAGREKSALIRPYIKELTEILSRNDVHDAVIRNAVRIFEAIDIPEKFRGKVMQACFKFLESNTAPGAIKAYSMTTLYNLSVIYPEIQRELKTILEDRWEYETPAFKSRGRKILSQLKKRQ